MISEKPHIRRCGHVYESVTAEGTYLEFEENLTCVLSKGHTGAHFNGTTHWTTDMLPPQFGKGNKKAKAP